VTARKYPPGAGRSDPVAAKAAAIEAGQAHPLTWKTIIKRALVIAVSGAAIYLVLPGLAAVLSSWPRLSALSPIWFTVAVAAELASFTCNFALQRLAAPDQPDAHVLSGSGNAGGTLSVSLPERPARVSRRESSGIPARFSPVIIRVADLIDARSRP